MDSEDRRATLVICATLSASASPRRRQAISALTTDRQDERKEPTSTTSLGPALIWTVSGNHCGATESIGFNRAVRACGDHRVTAPSVY